MKKYIQPTTHMIVINTEHQLLAESNGVQAVTGVNHLSVSQEEYGGGESDSRGTSWSDDEDL